MRPALLLLAVLAVVVAIIVATRHEQPAHTATSEPVLDTPDPQPVFKLDQEPQAVGQPPKKKRASKKRGEVAETRVEKLEVRTRCCDVDEAQPLELLACANATAATGPNTKGVGKVLILTQATDDVAKWAGPSAAWNAAYAATHGYALVVEDAQPCAESMDQRFGKVALLRKWVASGLYDWVVWVDADVLLLDLAGDVLAQVMHFAGTDNHLLLSRDDPEYLPAEGRRATETNTGVMVVRANAWAGGFLARWWEHEAAAQGESDQAVLDQIMQEAADLRASGGALEDDPRDHIQVLPTAALNSGRLTSRGIQAPRQQPVLHLAGFPADAKTAVFQEARRRLCAVEGAGEEERGAGAVSMPPELIHSAWLEPVVEAALRDTAADRDGDALAAVDAAQRLGELLQHGGRFADAVRLLQGAVARLRAERPDRMLRLSDLLNDLGVLLEKAGREEEAVVQYQESLSIKENEVGKGHPLMATTLNNLAESYRVAGKLKFAAKWHKRALAILKAEYGDRHPLVAKSLNNLGTVREAEGDVEKALELYMAAAGICREAFGEADEASAVPLNNLCMLANKMGNHEKALELCEVAHRIWHDTLGPQHPNVAVAQLNIALAFMQMPGHLEDAMHRLHHVITVRENSLGVDHKDTMSALAFLGDVLEKMDEQQQQEGNGEESANRAHLEGAVGVWKRMRDSGVEQYSEIGESKLQQLLALHPQLKHLLGEN